MYELSTIQETVTQVAEAITIVLEIETEIVDHRLKIISGTGRYKKKVGDYEENGDLESPYIYGTLVRTGAEYICLDTVTDPKYHPAEGELAEISCPIKIEGELVGIIGLIAFTKEQQSKIRANAHMFLHFLRQMALLISSKLIESQSSTKLAMLLESMPDGLLASDLNGNIFACNFTSEQLLHTSREELIGRKISDLFPDEAFFSQQADAGSIQSRTVAVPGDDVSRFYFTSVPIPQVGTMYLFEDSSTAAQRIQGSYFDDLTTFDDILGSSPQMTEIKQRAFQVANNDSTILITGESGTGKELFARSIHNHSDRRTYPFISINCGAIPDTLLESELFGYEKGAFTGANIQGKIGKLELGNHGTIFLDEIGDMPLHLQVKLLRFLQDRTIERVGGIASIPVDVRIIAATNQPLEEMIKRKEFREDLFFRLSVIPLQIPPLRERTGDVVPLLNQSLEKFNRLMGKNVMGFTTEALSMLMEYTWPGNVRELENTVEYCINVASGILITPSNLPDRIHRQLKEKLKSGSAIESEDVVHLKGGSLRSQVEEAEKMIIRRTLQHTGYSLAGKRAAAEALEISESTLYRKMRELGMNK